jgi:hypothetical protein
MLSDHDIEAALLRYRVIDPPTRLGPAIAAAVFQPRTRFDSMWGPLAAAAMLAIWMAAHLVTVEEHVDPSRAQEVALVTEVIGGGENAAAYAEIAVPVIATQDSLRALAEDPWQGN